MKNLLFLSLGLASLTLVSCSQDDAEQQSMNKPTPITFVSSVAQTRSANTSLQKVQIANGVEVGVFAKTASGYITNGNNAKLTADGNGTFTGTQLYFPTDGSAVSVSAYAPYSAAFSGKDGEAVAFSVAADQSSDAGYLKSDLLCGAPTGTNSFTEDNPTVALNFVHKLSKLTIKFTLGDDTDVDLKGAVVNIINTLPTTSLKVSDGTVGSASGSATTIKAVTFANDATTFLASAVIVPQAVSAGSFIQIILADKMLDAKLNSAATFVSGKAYTYNVNISGSGAETKAEIVLDSTVTDWVDDETELTGDVTEEELPEVTYSPTSFSTPGGNATYENGVYTWTGSTNNLMTIVEFTAGELADFKTLEVTTSNMSEGANWRMGYVLDGGSFTQFAGSPYYSAGTKTVDLKALAESGVDLSKVTKIQMGGNSGSGSIEIVPSGVVLKGNTGSGNNDNTSGDNTGDDNTSGDNTGGDSNTLTATFGTPGGNASYNAPTYTWTAGNNNLMTVFEFGNGELANYTTLKFTFSNLVDGPVRMGYYVGSTFTEFGNGYYSAGTKEVDLTALGIDLSTVTKIAFGGKSSGGSCDIVATDVILIGNADGTDNGNGNDNGNDNDNGNNGGKLAAAFGTPGGNASYDANTSTYSWTGSTNNLMNCFTFENGELANYTTLNFAFSELSDGASVRINVLFSDNTNKSKSYYSAGTKATAVTELLDDTHSAADVTAIRFGGNSNSGSTVVKASDMYLE